MYSVYVYVCSYCCICIYNCTIYTIVFCVCIRIYVCIYIYTCAHVLHFIDICNVVSLCTLLTAAFNISLELQGHCSDQLTLICRHSYILSDALWMHNGTTVESGEVLATAFPGAMYSVQSNKEHRVTILWSGQCAGTRRIHHSMCVQHRGQPH